jgi:translocation and assembly module TamA
VAACALLLALAGPASAGITVDVQGVDGELRRNVLLFLSLERYKTQSDLDAALLERLVARVPREVAAAVRPFGYYEPRVTAGLAAEGPGAWRVRVQVEPGEPVTLDEVDVRVTGPGAQTPAFRAIVGGTALRVGARLDHSAYDATKGALQRTAANLGYFDSRLLHSELQVDVAARRARVALELETGLRYRFGATGIEQQAIDPSLARRFLRYAQDDPYDTTELLRTQFAFDDSQYFERVEVVAGEPDRAALVVPVSIRADPVRRSRYTFAAGYATDTRARATLGWENRRLNARGHRLRAELQAAQQAQTATATYSVPIGDPALEKLSGEFRSARVDVGDLEISVAEFEPSLSQVRGNWQRVLGTRVTRTRTIIDRPPNLLLDETDVLAIPGISFSRVPRGYLGEALFTRALYAELRGSTPALGAPVSYLQVLLEAERAFDLADTWHLVLRGRLDASLVDDTAGLPGSERFFAGGDRSVRGFGYNELSPRDPSGARVGARHAFVASVEVVRDLPRNLGIAAFVDAGNAFDQFGDPLQYSVGIGLRWRLPVVTIGIDVAQPLTNPDCTAARPDARCSTTAGFDSLPGPRLHLNISPKL